MPERNREQKIIYVAGPISGDRENHAAAFEAAADELRRKGFAVVNPAATSATLPREALSREDLMRLGVTLLSFCDAAYVLPGWQDSLGATMERDFALAAGKPVYTLLDVIQMPDVVRTDERKKGEN